MSLRTAFLESASAARSLLAHPDVERRWDSPSVLEGLTVGALCAHLTRAVATLSDYLARPDADGREDLLDAPGYFLSIEGLSGRNGPDLASELHLGIRRRSEFDAADGPAAVLARWDETIERLAGRLATEPPTRVVEVFGGRAMFVDDYVITRLIEMLVHSDDLAASLGLETPRFPATASTRVLACLTEIAVRAHGPMAVIRAMTRTERDDVGALRVL